LWTLSLALAVAVASTAPALAQEPEQRASPPAAPARDEGAVVPLKVTVTIGRFQGEKRISSIPYSIAVSSGSRYVAHLRMGAQVPIAVTTFGSNDARQPQSWNYKDIGTNIDCGATALDAGRYLLSLTIEDSSVYPEDQAPSTIKGISSFRSFRSSETVVLRDGQSMQFVAATDKLTGETVRVDVALVVVK
jgi:hypothetical protein